MYQQTIQSIIPEEDLANTVLCDLKRVVREYATAATESSCPSIRQQFTRLMDSTLAMQGKLFTVLKQNNMYSAASPALRQELDKQMKSSMQCKQKTQQFLQRTLPSQQYQQSQQSQMQSNTTFSYGQHQQQQQNSGQGQSPYFM